VHWTTSGKAVLMVVLGGIGTLWGPGLGAALVVQLEDYLATAGFVGIDMVVGAVFVVVVLLFRRGVWGTVSVWSARLGARRRASRAASAAGAGPSPSPQQRDADRESVDATRKGD